jgi:hypothetical protein
VRGFLFSGCSARHWAAFPVSSLRAVAFSAGGDGGRRLLEQRQSPLSTPAARGSNEQIFDLKEQILGRDQSD